MIEIVTSLSSLITLFKFALIDPLLARFERESTNPKEYLAVILDNSEIKLL